MGREEQKLNEMVHGIVTEPIGLVFREQCIGAVRGLRMLNAQLRADVEKLRKAIREEDDANDDTEKPAGD